MTESRGRVLLAYYLLLVSLELQGLGMEEFDRQMCR